MARERPSAWCVWIAALLVSAACGALRGDEPARSPGGGPPDAASRPFRPADFQLYYGGDPALVRALLERIEAGQVTVVETAALTPADLAALIERSQKAGAKVLAYLSIGELHDDHEPKFRQFLEKHLAGRKEAKRFPTLDALTVSRNEKFHTRRVDALAQPWRAYVQAEADRLYALGVHGLFLDTVDTVDVCISREPWPLDRRIESVRAMMSLIRQIKAARPEGFVLQNRGLNLIGRTVFDAVGKEIAGLNMARDHAGNPDGILWENAFAADDAWTRLKETELAEIQSAGQRTVFAQGYEETHPSRADFFQKCAAAGFIAAWATSSERLHEELTSGPPRRAGK